MTQTAFVSKGPSPHCPRISLQMTTDKAGRCGWGVSGSGLRSFRGTSPPFIPVDPANSTDVPPGDLAKLHGSSQTVQNFRGVATVWGFRITSLDSVLFSLTLP